MNMLRFRVQNYKKIEDSGWIHTKNITAFVGKNEAGKSALFRGLSKLNPSDKSEYDGLKEFPRRRYSSEFKKKDWIVSSVEFELDDVEKSELTKISSSLSKVTSVTVHRYYDNGYAVNYNPEISRFTLYPSEYVSMLKEWKDMVAKARAPEGKGELLHPIKNNLTSVIDAEISSIPTSDEIVINVEKQIPKMYSNINQCISEDWIETIFKKIIDEISSLNDQCKIESELSSAFNWVLHNIPKFIYFDRYDVLDSAIHIDDFIHNLSEKLDDPKLRITKCLFEHAGLDIEQIRKLDPNDEQKTRDKLKRMADERAIEMSSASQTMTQRFTSWWEQRKHKFSYQIDGKNFRVWVSDDLDPSEIELDQRSAGMQYFFSFYLVFLVEASGDHANSILLLDEPGLQFHGTAQQKTVEFLNKISKDNQLLYTTHSPFMIDGDRLENVKIVFEDAENFGVTKVSDDVWPNDKDSLFPLQAGLGYSLAQTLFYSKYQLVVEGLTDYTLLKSMNEILSQNKMSTLDSNIVISPAGGTKNIMPLASMLVANNIQIAVLLDGDQQGSQKGKSLKEKLLVNSIIVDSFTDKVGSEIEDFFEDSLYIEAVKTAYPKHKIIFNANDAKIVPIVDRIESVFTRAGYGKLKKWKVNNVLIDWIVKQSSEKKISDATCKKFEKLFQHINEILIK